MATSAYSVDAANPGRSRLEALATLGASPLEPNALFKLCEACVLLGRNTEAVAALSAGAAHHPHLSDFFHKRARSLGAWTILGPDDVLFIPRGHWHYVRALTPAFSLNFWF